LTPAATVKEEASGVGNPERDMGFANPACTGELNQNTIAGKLDDASAVCGDCGVNQLFAKGLDRAQGADVVQPHETGIPRHVGSEYCRKSPVDALFLWHRPTCRPKDSPRKSCASSRVKRNGRS
jgi:hypothetical protein